MNTEQLNKLKELAQKATKGPWMTWPTSADNGEYTGLEVLTHDGGALITEETHPSDDDALFIAAANPATILELIAIAEKSLAAPTAQQPVAWWRYSYIDEDGSHDLDMYYGADPAIHYRDNGHSWNPLYAAAQAPAQADSRRLDFMATEECRIESLTLASGTRYRVHWPLTEEAQREWSKTPREAIDAAMSTTGDAAIGEKGNEAGNV